MAAQKPLPKFHIVPNDLQYLFCRLFKHIFAQVDGESNLAVIEYEIWINIAKHFSQKYLLPIATHFLAIRQGEECLHDIRRQERGKVTELQCSTEIRFKDIPSFVNGSQIIFQ